MDSKINSEMLVAEMIEAIENKEFKIIDLAKRYSFSDRSIQTKIKNLGFEWKPKEAKYNFVGNDKSVYNLAIGEVFKKAIQTNSKTTSITAIKNDAKKESEKAIVEVASTLQSNSKSTPENDVKIDSKIDSISDIKNNSKRTSKKAIGSNSDNIDRLLAGKKAKKEYRGFYIDSDVLGVIEGVANGVKSELVNECLRKVFKEKGLL